MEIDRVLDFIGFTQKFRRTERHIYAVGENRMENDVEHSYQLAILGWYLIESEKLPLDISLVIKYSLIHDLEEALTGDKNIFDDKGRKNKEELENKARAQILKMFPDWEEYKILSQNYRLLKDEESRFVNGLDKVLPVINIYLDGGRIWKTEDVNLAMLSSNKKEKTKVHPIAEIMWKQIEAKLKDRELELFGKLS